MRIVLKMFLLTFGAALHCVGSSPVPQDMETAILNGIGMAKDAFDQGAAAKHSGQHEIGFGPAVFKTNHDVAVGFGDAMKSGDRSGDDDDDRRRKRRSTILGEEFLLAAEDNRVRRKRAPCGRGKGTGGGGAGSGGAGAGSGGAGEGDEFSNAQGSTDGGGQLARQRAGQQRRNTRRVRRQADKVTEEMDELDQSILPQRSDVVQHVRQFADSFKDAWTEAIDSMRSIVESVKTTVAEKLGSSNDTTDY